MAFIVTQALEMMKTHVVKTSPDSTLAEAVDLMDLYQVDGLPVVDAEGRLCGMLTEHDVCQALLPLGVLPDQDGKALERLRAASAQGSAHVRDYMNAAAISVLETQEIHEAALLLLRHGLKRLPVLDTEGRVVGTLNRIDLWQALFEGNL